MSARIDMDLDRYLDLYLSYPVAHLVQQYDQIEKDLLESLFSNCQEIARNSGFTVAPPLVIRGDDVYELSSDFLSTNRQLVFYIRSISQTGKVSHAESRIDDIGYIRSVCVVAPEELGELSRLISNSLADQTRAAYLALRAAFLSNSDEFYNSAMKPVYEVFVAHLHKHNSQHLIGRFWLCVFEGELGYYSFDRDTLRAALDHYKNNQQDLVSPFRMTIWMASEPLPFSKSLSSEALSSNKALQQQFSQAKFIRSAQNFWRANRHLVDSESYAAMPIAKTRQYSLTLISSSEHKAELEHILLHARPSMKNVFEAGIKECSIWIRGIKKIKRAASSSSSADFLSSVIAKLGAEIVKGNM